MTALPIKNHPQPPLQASKWLKLPMLVDALEMQALLSSLGDYWIFLVSGVVGKGEEVLRPEMFLNCYASYVEALKQGELPEDPRLRAYFSSVLTVTPEALYAFPVSEQKNLVKVEKPVVQLQPHKFDYSKLDGKFRSMVFGLDSIHWGIQFSYPQLYQDGQMQVKKVIESPEFPNTALFKTIQKWSRQFTLPTPFLILETQTQVNVPIRIGKNCLSWINRHPQLAAKGLKVLI